MRIMYSNGTHKKLITIFCSGGLFNSNGRYKIQDGTDIYTSRKINEVISTLDEITDKPYEFNLYTGTGIEILQEKHYNPKTKKRKSFMNFSLLAKIRQKTLEYRLRKAFNGNTSFTFIPQNSNLRFLDNDLNNKSAMELGKILFGPQNSNGRIENGIHFPLNEYKITYLPEKNGQSCRIGKIYRYSFE